MILTARGCRLTLHGGPTPISASSLLFLLGRFDRVLAARQLKKDGSTRQQQPLLSGT